MPDEARDLRRIARELPRKPLAFVLFVLVAHVAVGSYRHGWVVGEMRADTVVIGHRHLCPTSDCDERARERVRAKYRRCVPPWEWKAYEWREAFPW